MTHNDNIMLDTSSTGTESTGKTKAESSCVTSVHRVHEYEPNPTQDVSEDAVFGDYALIRATPAQRHITISADDSARRLRMRTLNKRIASWRK